MSDADGGEVRWHDVRLVAGREVGEKLRSRAFLLSTLLFLALVAASIALPALLYDDGPTEYDVAAVGPAVVALAQALPPDLVDVTVTEVPDRAAAERLLRDEEVEAALELGPDGPVLTALQEVPGTLRDALADTLQAGALQSALERAGVPAVDRERLLAPPDVPTRLLEASELDPAAVPLLSVAFVLLFFFVVFQFGQSIAQGVVQEKESRIVELLVSAVPVRTLLYGKVLGNGGLALTQIVLLVLVGMAGALATGERELLSLLLRNAGWFVLFFALGFALLSCLWAAAGAMASRSEDLQATTAPLQVLLIAPFFAAVYVTSDPARVVLSYVPLTAPLVMPARLLEDDAALWEGALSALLVLATAVVAVRVGERLYRASLLRTRGRTSLADAWSGRAGGGS
ncbi:MAG: ABC transporter permease [Frankiaceae bacterium]|nr:ABC transporter permease [Frankiaceae bacterium]